MTKQVKTLFEFCFQVGEIINLLKQDDAGWWEGELNGRKGLFPSNYVEPYVAPITATRRPPLAPAGGAKYSAVPLASVNSKAPGKPIPTSHTAAASSSPRADPPLKANPVSAAALPENKPSTFSAFGGGGDRKPAGKVTSGADSAAAAPRAKAVLVSQTKIGLWSSNIAFYSGIFMVPLGLASILWHLVDEDNHPFQVLLCGAYSVVVGIGIVWWESYWGQKRGKSRFPLRALVYLALSIYLFFTISTVLCGVFLLLACITNFVACVIMQEVYDDATAGKSHAAATSDLVRVDSFCEGISAWFTMIKQQNKAGALAFISFYTFINMFLFGYTVNAWVLANAALAPVARLSQYGPWAKGFGAMLDLNCAMIVVPVSRTLLRMLYNRSTADQGCFARSLRRLLYFIPIDQNILFHKIIARFILFAACGHITFHFVNLAFAYENTLAIFGRSAWITGGLICVSMMMIYSSVPDNTRRGQFEIFWYSHHCFVLFFIFILIHGKNGINPHYWQYAIPTMAIYITERVLRIYRASLPVSLLSITLMDDVMSLEFAKEGPLEGGYSEGQYLFLLSPPISRIQWHPFTISSAPQEHSVTVHIRVCGEGSWTRGLQQYLSTMGPKGKSYIKLDRLGPNGKVPGKILGPDGRSIIQIDGPHAAPTQHVGEYSTVIVVGAGIGATPVSSTLKSIVFYKWRVNVGECFPAHAYFMWVCAYRDIDAFRWLLRTIKEAQDEIVHLRATTQAMKSKTFEFHIFLTSAPKTPKPVEVVVDDEIGFWGPPREASKLDKMRANWDEVDLYKVMKCPPAHSQLGDVHIWEGRPKWGDRFKAVAAAQPNCSVGVAFCGNPMIAKDLRKQCFIQNKTREPKTLFKLHKENF